MGHLFLHEEYVYKNFKTLAFTVKTIIFHRKVEKSVQSKFKNNIFFFKIGHTVLKS